MRYGPWFEPLGPPQHSGLMGEAEACSMKPELVIVALCVCLAASVKRTEASGMLLPDPQRLPAAHQPTDRILAVMTLADPIQRGPDRLSRQLAHYVGACEAGFEVHVVIVTFQKNWTSLEYLFAPARNLCTRLMAEMPVALYVQETLLAARHREVFAAKVGMYDYYLSHEDDVLYMAHHFRYFKHWSHLLQAAPLLHPGFYLFEVPKHHVLPHSLLTYSPACTYDEWRSDMHLIKWQGHLLAILRYGYDASYMLTNKQLRKFTSYPAWLGAKDVQWSEFNVPFQGQFLNNYVFRVLPISHLNRAMLHHTSDKYTNRAVRHAASKIDASAMGRRVHGPDIMSELLLILRQCTGLAVETPSTITPPYGESNLSIEFELQGHPDGTVHPCTVCFNNNEAVWLELNVTSVGGYLFHNETSTASIAPSTARVKVFCRKTVAKQASHGCGKADDTCSAKNETWWGGPLLDMHTDLMQVLAEAPSGHPRRLWLK